MVSRGGGGGGLALCGRAARERSARARQAHVSAGVGANQEAQVCAEGPFSQGEGRQRSWGGAGRATHAPVDMVRHLSHEEAALDQTAGLLSQRTRLKDRGHVSPADRDACLEARCLALPEGTGGLVPGCSGWRCWMGNGPPAGLLPLET